MHVSILAGLLLVSSAYSEHEARVAAPFHHLVRVGVVEAHRRRAQVAAPAERLKRLPPRTRAWPSAIGRGFVQCTQPFFGRSHAELRSAPPLRRRLAHFFAKAKRSAVTMNALLAVQRVCGAGMHVPLHTQVSGSAFAPKSDSHRILTGRCA